MRGSTTLKSLSTKTYMRSPRKRDFGADVRSGAKLKGRDRLLCLRYDRPLTGDRSQLAHRGIERLRIGDRLTDAHVNDDLLQLRNLVDVLIPEALLKLRPNLLLGTFLLNVPPRLTLPSPSRGPVRRNARRCDARRRRPCGRGAGASAPCISRRRTAAPKAAAPPPSR